MPSPRSILAFVLVLALLPGGGAWAHGPVPDSMDGPTGFSASGADGMRSDGTVEASYADGSLPAGDDGAAGHAGCGHHVGHPAVEGGINDAVDDGVDDPAPSRPPTPEKPQHTCCKDGNCPCPPPIGKGMAIGPAHLARLDSIAPQAVLPSAVPADGTGDLLRPPIP